MVRRCAYCGHELSLKDIVDFQRFKKRKYGRNIVRIVYRCPRCSRLTVLERPYARVEIEDKDEGWKFVGKFDKAAKKRVVDTIFRRKRDGKTSYIDHEVFGENGRIEHFAIKGLRDYEEGKVSFNNEWVEIDKGRKKGAWKRRR